MNETLTTEQRIERNYWEHEWCVIWPDRDDYPAADLDALVKAGKLTETVLVCCPGGHGAWAGPPGEAESHFGDCAACDDPSRDPGDYAIIERKFVMSDDWKASLGKVRRECQHCDGTGKEPIVYCEECKKPCDSDGYCDPCANAAVEKWSAEHGGRSPAEEFRLRKTERAEATEAAIQALLDVHAGMYWNDDADKGMVSGWWHGETDTAEIHGRMVAALRTLGRLP